MPPKQKKWSDTQTIECIRQFNLFRVTKGKQGWDPEKNDDPNYIKDLAKRSSVLKPYVQKSLGGYEGNKDSSKVIRGYERAACEWWVALAKRGIRRGAFVGLACLLLIHILLLIFFASNISYLPCIFIFQQTTSKTWLIGEHDKQTAIKQQ